MLLYNASGPLDIPLTQDVSKCEKKFENERKKDFSRSLPISKSTKNDEESRRLTDREYLLIFSISLSVLTGPSKILTLWVNVMMSSRSCFFWPKCFLSVYIGNIYWGQKYRLEAGLISRWVNRWTAEWTGSTSLADTSTACYIIWCIITIRGSTTYRHCKG